MAKNYYIIIGVSPNASQEEIKSAYRRRVKEFHPDHYGDDCEPFLAIQEAYAVLGDPVRRRAYDELIQRRPFPSKPAGIKPEPIISKQPRGEPLSPREHRYDYEDISLTRSFQTFFPSFEEIFDRLWANFLDRSRPKSENIKSLNVEIAITPFQAFRGGHVRILLPAQTQCPTCLGQGYVGFYDCWRCAGAGIISGELPVIINLPAGIPDNYTVRVPLDRLGIHNFYLTAIFRITEDID